MAPSADPAELAPPDGTWLVAYEADRPVGCGGIKRLDALAAEVKRVYVRPEARGLGAGRALMRELEAAARGLGFTRLRLDVGASQPEALALYRDLGFSEIGDYNSNPYASYWLQKDL